MSAFPDPNTATRENFTLFLVNRECPSNASPKYRNLYTSHQRLVDLLAHHPAMVPNLQQTYMTPAASKNKVYFMWDFVGRTLGMLFNVDPARPIGTVWEDCTMRAMMAQMLIKDKTGKLDAMNRSSGYNTDAGIEFGTELLNVAEALTV